MWNRGDISGTDWISDGVKYIEHLTVQQTIQFQEKSEKWKNPFGNICSRLLDNVWRLRQHSEIFINSNYGNPFPKLVPAVALQSVTRHDLNILEFSFTISCIILLTAKRWMLNAHISAAIRMEVLFSNWFHGTSLQAPSAIGTIKYTISGLQCQFIHNIDVLETERVV